MKKYLIVAVTLLASASAAASAPLFNLDNFKLGGASDNDQWVRVCGAMDPVPGKKCIVGPFGQPQLVPDTPVVVGNTLADTLCKLGLGGPGCNPVVLERDETPWDPNDLSKELEMRLDELRANIGL